MFARFAATALLLPAVHAFWIHGFPKSESLMRLDPIVNEGTVSPHMHVVIGSDAFGPKVTSDSLRAGSCTTNPVTADMSSYWASQLYHRNENSTYSAVPHLFSNVYYLPRGGPTIKDSEVKAFPDNLRMLAGDPKRSTYNATKHEDAAVSYVCLDYYATTGVRPPQSTFPTEKCPDGVRAQVVFPSCWDGKNTDSADHKSHMSYPIGAVDSGDCPTTHPTKLVTIFYEFVFDVNQWSDRGEKSFVWASGEGEYSFHADFANGWRAGVLQDAIDQCGTRGDIFNDVEKCPALAPYVDRKAQDACKIPVLVDEATGLKTPVANIPGCNQDYLTKSVGRCDGSLPAIEGVSPATPGSGSSSAVSASSTSSSPAATYSSAPAASSSSTVSASAAATSSGVASVSLPGGNLAVSTPASMATPTGAATATPTTVATTQPAPTKVCKHTARAAGALAEKRKRAVQHHHARRSVNRLSH